MENSFKYIDCHTHAQFAAFKDDYKEVIGRALEAGVAVVNIGTQKDTSLKAVEVAHEFDKSFDPELRTEGLTTSEFSGGVWACVGLHPIHTDKSFHDADELGSSSDSKGFTSRGEDFNYDYYKKLALDPKTVAIGECGLDYYRFEQIANRESQIEKQKEAFIKQIELAKDVGKPLMIHCRGSINSPQGDAHSTHSTSSGQTGSGQAFSDLIKILDANKNKLNDKSGIIHFFSGNIEDAKKLLDLGFYFTFGGVITFPPKAGQPSAGTYMEVIKMIPMGRILSETDAPYVTPEPYRGKRNEPAYVIYVVRKLAEIKGVSEEEMAERILENAKKVFGI